jgi:DNA-binding NarL/FixJ family response regulator
MKTEDFGFLLHLNLTMKIFISSRELAVLRKSVDGLSVKQIAIELNLQPHEIAQFQKEICQKTGASTSMMALQNLASYGFTLTEESIRN